MLELDLPKKSIKHSTLLGRVSKGCWCFVEMLPGSAKNLPGGLGGKTVTGICAGGSAVMLKWTHGLPRLGGVAVGTCCAAKSFRHWTWMLSYLSPIWSLKKRALRLMTGYGLSYSSASGVLCPSRHTRPRCAVRNASGMASGGMQSTVVLCCVCVVWPHCR